MQLKVCFPPRLVKQIENPIRSTYLHLLMLTKGTHKEWHLMEIYVDLRRIDPTPFLLHLHHLLSNISRRRLKTKMSPCWITEGDACRWFCFIHLFRFAWNMLAPKTLFFGYGKVSGRFVWSTIKDLFLFILFFSNLLLVACSGLWNVLPVFVTWKPSEEEWVRRHLKFPSCQISDEPRGKNPNC